MQNKSIHYEFDKISNKLLPNDGKTFDDILSYIYSRHFDVGGIFSDPRTWAIKNQAEEAFSKKDHAMSNLELSDEFFLLMTLDPVFAREFRSVLSQPEHKDKALLQAVLDIISKKPVYIISIISNPLIKIGQAKAFANYFNFGDPLSFQNSDASKINEEMEALGFRLKAFVRELALRWSR